MNRPFLVLAPLAILLLASCSVTPTEFSRSGVYLGGSGLVALANFDLPDEGVDGGWPETGEYSGGFGVRGGYRTWDRFAFEVAYEGAMKFRGDDVDLRVENVALQGKFFPLTGWVQPYVLAGVGYGQFEADQVEFDEKGMIYRLGGGLEVYLLDVLPLFLELNYTWPVGDIEGFEYASLHLGALFRF